MGLPSQKRRLRDRITLHVACFFTLRARQKHNVPMESNPPKTIHGHFFWKRTIKKVLWAWKKTYSWKIRLTCVYSRQKQCCSHTSMDDWYIHSRMCVPPEKCWLRPWLGRRQSAQTNIRAGVGSHYILHHNIILSWSIAYNLYTSISLFSRKLCREYVCKQL